MTAPIVGRVAIVKAILDLGDRPTIDALATAVLALVAEGMDELADEVRVVRVERDQAIRQVERLEAQVATAFARGVEQERERAVKLLCGDCAQGVPIDTRHPEQHATFAHSGRITLCQAWRLRAGGAVGE